MKKATSKSPFAKASPWRHTCICRDTKVIAPCERSGSSNGILVDYASDGRPIGLELTSPKAFSLEQLNGVLAQVDQPPMQIEDLRPLIAA